MVGRDHGAPTPSWWSATAPATSVANATNTWVGNTLKFTVPGRVWGFRYYSVFGSGSRHWAVINDQTTGKLLFVKSFMDFLPPGPAWVQAWCHPTIRINTTDLYEVAVSFPSHPYARTNGALGSFVTHNGITFQNGFQSTVWDLLSVSLVTNTNANGVDVLFRPD
jgi:hypothetical protein